MKAILFFSLFFALITPASVEAAPAKSIAKGEPADPGVHTLYLQHCSECHHPERLGAMGPALLPENLHRLRAKKAKGVIAEGRVATQMPPFKEILSPDQIDALVKYIYTSPNTPLIWGEKEIIDSHIIHNEPDTLPGKPVFKVADLFNLFLVVELGDHHVTLLDGDRFEPIHRFPSRYALHGGPKYGPNGRFVYFGSRDGWVSKFDIYSLELVAEIRVGINTRNVAVSGDGKWVMAANYLPHTLVILDGEKLEPVQVIPVVDDAGHSSRVSAVYAAAPRNSFIAALKDIPEIWEIPYQDGGKGKSGLKVRQVDAASNEVIPGKKGPFSARRIKVEVPLDDFFFDQSYKNLIGASRTGVPGQVVDLDAGQKTAEIDMPGMPHLGSGITWEYQGRKVMASPNLKDGVVSVIDLETWEVIKRIETLGPGFFMRSHENSPYAWVDVFFGPNRDAMHVIDKSKLEIVKTLRPAPGKVSGHIEFTRDGSHALLSIWDKDGALIIYNGHTLEEIKRIPMKKPSGKYNVHNKVTRSAGTSH
ncbi:MAG: c-type cytochrome [Magnetococcales bacterium]|nr:c-type cytochrome [Magnetococcales bacterium]